MGNHQADHREIKMQDEKGYLFNEKLSSARTTLLFITLITVFFLLALWRTKLFTDWNALGAVFLFLAFFFLFYASNYRTLNILVNPYFLQLKSGIIKWKGHIDNIENVQLDEIPILLRYGGAGIHFKFVRKRYRASFNFLEYPRACVSLMKKRGWVKDLSFSTRQPEKMIQVLNEFLG